MSKQKALFRVQDTSLIGKGLFANTGIIPETKIGLYLSKSLTPIVEGRVLYDGWIESIPIARYANHSSSPNCKVSLIGSNTFLISTTAIKENEQITVNYIEVAELIKLPLDEYDKYGIKDFAFESYELELKKSVI